MDTGQIIRQIRLDSGLSQKEFAHYLGMKKNGERTVSGWERGEHQPSRAKLDQIASLDYPIPFKNDRDNHDFTFIDLFAGVGGIRLPFQLNGGKCVFTSEWDKFSKKTYASNYGEWPKGDITAINSEDIPEHDVLLAGFPCQAFSRAGKREGFQDIRGTMFFEVQRILAHHQPKAFLLENVKQLRGHDEGRTLDTMLSILRGEYTADLPSDIPMSAAARRSLRIKLDYETDFRVLRSNDFGVPQKRERVYIVGFNRKKCPDVDLDAMFARLVKSSEATRLGDVLEDDDKVEKRFTISDKLYEGHIRRSERHRKKGNGFSYGLFNKESPYCNTISARYYKDGREILIDQSHLDKNPRKLTPRECARILGFPEEFRVDAVSVNQLYRQMGNSVSIPVIQAIADQMVPSLLEKTIPMQHVANG